MKPNLLLLLFVLVLGACGNKVVPQSALKEEVELDKVDYKKNGFKAGTVFDNTGLQVRESVLQMDQVAPRPSHGEAEKGVVCVL